MTLHTVALYLIERPLRKVSCFSPLRGLSLRLRTRSSNNTSLHAVTLLISGKKASETLMYHPLQADSPNALFQSSKSKKKLCWILYLHWNLLIVFTSRYFLVWFQWKESFMLAHAMQNRAASYTWITLTSLTTGSRASAPAPGRHVYLFCPVPHLANIC